MKKIIWVAIMTLTSLAFAESVPTEQFLESIQGSYTIDLANGSKPEQTSGSVLIQPTQAMMVLPFCGAGFCNPGYLMFPFATTTVTETLHTADEQVFDIYVKGAHFQWDEKGSEVYFTNYQFAVQPNDIITVVHQIHKD